VALYTAIDTRFHCLEALQVITNQDAGRNAEDWRAWYELNKDKSQEAWIRDGFAKYQLPVATPPGDMFVATLIRASDPKYRPEYIRTNALRMLKTIQADTVIRLARPLAESTDVAGKRGTVAALEIVGVGGTERLTVLRRLAGDDDVDVAETH
jgi:hypothetical protein